MSRINDYEDDFLPYANRPLPQDFKEDTYPEEDELLDYIESEYVNNVVSYLPTYKLIDPLELLNKAKNKKCVLNLTFTDGNIEDMISYETFKNGDTAYILNSIQQQCWKEESVKMLLQRGMVHPITKKTITKIEKVIISY